MRLFTFIPSSDNSLVQIPHNRNMYHDQSQYNPQHPVDAIRFYNDTIEAGLECCRFAMDWNI